MTFFVDANVLIYSAVESEYRRPCLEVLDAIARGEAEGRTSTAVLEEVWHIELSGRAGDLDRLTERLYKLFTPLIAVTDEAVRRALALDAPQLGSNDRLHVATCLANGIEHLLSADREFDDVPEVQRADPLDADARERLLGF